MSFTTWQLSWDVLQQFTILKGRANYWKTSLLYCNFWPSLMLAVFLKWVFGMYNHSYLTNLVHKTVTGRQVTEHFCFETIIYFTLGSFVSSDSISCYVFLETLKAKYVSWNVRYSPLQYTSSTLCFCTAVVFVSYCLTHTKHMQHLFIPGLKIETVHTIYNNCQIPNTSIK